MRAQLYALQLKEQELLSIYTPEAQQVREVRQQLQGAQTLLRAEEAQRTQVTNSINQIRQAAEQALLTNEGRAAALQRKGETLQEQLKQASDEQAALNASEIDLDEAERELSLADANYRRYAENLEQ